MKVFATRALLVFGSVLLVLGIVEGVIRALGLAPLPNTVAGGFRPDNPLLRLLKPHDCSDFGAPDGAYFVEVCTNGIGLRDRDHAAGENPKVLALGDSFTFGWGVELNDSFPAGLERALRLGLPSVKPGVFNAGLSYTSQAHQDVLLHFLYEREKFDLVVLAFSEDNDIDENIVWNPNLGVYPAQGQIPAAAVDSYRDELTSAVFKDTAYRRSALVRFFRQRRLRTSMASEVAAIDESLRRHGLSGAPLERMVADEARRRFIQAFGTKFDDDFQVTELLLDRLRRFLADRGTPLVLVRIPSRMSVEDDAWSSAVSRFCGEDPAAAGEVCGKLDRAHTSRRLEAYAKTHRLGYLDPEDDLREATKRGERMYLTGDIHLSRLGHARLSEKLAKTILPRLGGGETKPSAAPSAAPPDRPAGRPKVGAYYYPWYRADDWRSFTDYTPRRGGYVSNDKKVVARQLHDADRGELDFLMVELLADHNPESKFNNEAVNATVQAILERRQRGFSRIEFALMTDIFVGEADIATPERWLDATKRHLDQIWTRYIEPHRDAYTHVDGKPLVGVFSPALPIEDPRFTIIRPYWVSHEQWKDWERKKELLPFWDTTPQTVTDPRFVSVTPGYNDWRLERQPQVGPYLPRLGGRTYLDQWKKVFEVRPEVVLVYSFNEFFEQTQIEPTKEQGDRYLLLNQILARILKDGRTPSAAEWDRLVDTIEPPAAPDEEKVAWLSIADPRINLGGMKVDGEGRLVLADRARIELDVESRQAFILGIARTPSFDRCAGLSVSVAGSGREAPTVFSTELTQLSILRDVPLPSTLGHVVLDLARVPADASCSNAGHRPIPITGITRYPLATAERLNIAVDDSRVSLDHFWPVEVQPSGAFVWSSDRSTVTISGLPAGVSHRVTLTFRDTAGFGSVELGPDLEHVKKVLLTPGKTATMADPLVVGTDGKLVIGLKTETWRPHDKFGSEDPRTLGVALRLITLDRMDGQSPHHDVRQQ